MLYVEKIENHKIGNNTPFSKVAKSLGWTQTIDESNTEKAYDGSLWEKGYAPKKTVELMQAEVRAVRNLLLAETDKFMILDYPLQTEESELYKAYRKYLRDYTLMENWWMENPLVFEEWQQAIAQEIATREQLYVQTSDVIRNDYLEAVARGSDNAEELKQAWLASKDKIREENPYVKEVDNGVEISDNLSED